MLFGLPAAQAFTSPGAHWRHYLESFVWSNCYKLFSFLTVHNFAAYNIPLFCISIWISLEHFITSSSYL